MRLPKAPDLHLTYCLNAHPGETLEEVIAAIEGPVRGIRRRVAMDQPFGLGLRLSAQAADELMQGDRLARFREMLRRHRLYVFTLNGFPYGRFHGTRVKEKVYEPDWRTTERREYTLQLIGILADLLEETREGSISTVPGSFKAWIERPGEALQMVKMLMDCVACMARIREKRGIEIHLGLEPEPGCYLESSRDVVAFFKKFVLPMGRKLLSSRLRCELSGAEETIRRHLGVCLDTCHAAVLFEGPAEAIRRYQGEGIRISKIQVTAAPEVRVSGAADGARVRSVLEPFCDEVYLHPVAVRSSRGRVRRWMDLPEALGEMKPAAGERIRSHFHIPLFFEGDGLLRSTSAELNGEFFGLLRKGVTHHLEIETYTFNVLPPSLRAGGVEENFRRESEWVLRRFREAT
jgi:sugar phosphate isomerase/epimerase